MKILAVLLLWTCVYPCLSRAAELDLAVVSCAKYENDVLNAETAAVTADPINTVMWLFGFSVGRSGDHVMYGDALSAFGFALDAECKDNPNTTLLAAAAGIKPKRSNPMDLKALSCAAFQKRHVELARTDPESANTIMMWLFGYAVGKSGSHVLDAGNLDHFGTALLSECTAHPDASLFDALTKVGATPAQH
jgi:hypothetical protein